MPTPPLEASSDGFALRTAKTIAGVTLPGMIAGFVAGGIGSRLAMRVLAVTSSDLVQGATTEAGATVGEISFGGTLFLLMAGTALGAGGGVVYLGIRRWLPQTRLRGAVFGLLLLALSGRLLIDPDNIDFILLSPDWLAVAMFAALPIGFGLLFVSLQEPLAEWVMRERSTPGTITLLALLLAPLAIGLLPAGLVLLAASAVYIAQGTRIERMWASPAVGIGGRVLLMALAAAGLALFVSGAADILA